MKKIAEGVMMVHLISAVPIVVNPPNQYFEELMEIPKCKFLKVLKYEEISINIIKTIQNGIFA